MDLAQFGMMEGEGAAPFMLDPNMCEVEIPGGVQDVQGDEPGLLMRTGSIDSSSLIFRSQPDYFSSVPSFSDAPQWVNRPQPSPAFTAPPTGILPRNSRASLTAEAPAGYLRSIHQSHSSTSSTSSSYGDEYATPSLSAPSHKQSFDHAALYPPGMLDGGGGGGGNIGPMRRHRSMTPSLIRNGEPIRRPMTASTTNTTSSEFTGGSPGSVSSSISSSSGAPPPPPRGYHPYAYSNSNSRANSTHSSPQVGAVPLAALEYVRSESRNSGYGGGSLHEQMMMNMNLDAGAGVGSGAGAGVFGDAVFRSGSPASFNQTESPAAFSMDLPMQFPAGSYVPQQQQQQQAILHAATMPMPVGSQYNGQHQQQQQHQYDGYYSQHATL